ncbi:MAG: FAD-binding protein, partial [Burkholderiales bacterium]|nr:FAD-binding protein [Burkholderiales bacterium]
MKRIATDVLILGSGGAGLFAALHAHAAAPELAITIAVKGLLGKCGCTRMVQGGYNVALNPGDSVERHFMDTIDGGKWLPHQELAWTLVTKAIERIEDVDLDDLNPESMWKFSIRDFGTLLVAMDSHGARLYDAVRHDVDARRAQVL